MAPPPDQPDAAGRVRPGRDLSVIGSPAARLAVAFARATRYMASMRNRCGLLPVNTDETWQRSACPGQLDESRKLSLRSLKVCLCSLSRSPLNGVGNINNIIFS